MLKVVDQAEHQAQTLIKWNPQILEEVRNQEVPQNLSAFLNNKAQLSQTGSEAVCSGSSGVVSG